MATTPSLVIVFCVVMALVATFLEPKDGPDVTHLYPRLILSFALQTALLATNADETSNAVLLAEAALLALLLRDGWRLLKHFRAYGPKPGR